MDIISQTYFQFRTLEKTYSFKVTQGKSALKIYDTASQSLHKLVFKEPVSQEELRQDPFSFCAKLVNFNILDKTYCPSLPEALPINLENCQQYLKLAIEEAARSAQIEDPHVIPTFSFFTEERPYLAQAYIATAKELAREGDIKAAIDNYKKAFEYTQDRKTYTDVSDLYKSEPKKQILSLLYLALYLIESKDLTGAVKSLEQAQNLQTGPSLPLNLSLIMLLRDNQEKAKELIQKSLPLLQKARHDVAFAFVQEALLYDQTDSKLYAYLASHKPEDKNRQLFLKGALAHLSKSRFLEAQTICSLTTPQNFEDLLVFCQSHPDTKEKLETLKKWTQIFLERKNFKSARQALKTCLLLEQASSTYENLIETYAQENKHAKALTKTIQLVDVYIQESDFSKAQEKAKKALETTENIVDKIALYEKLGRIYLKQNNMKGLEELWSELGEAYEKVERFNDAEDLYTEARKIFKNPFFSIRLIKLFVKMKKSSEEQNTRLLTVLNHYTEAEKAILTSDKDLLERSYQAICEVDPQMEHLTDIQKIYLGSQRQLFTLSFELQTLKERLSEIEAKQTELRRKQIPRFGASEWAKHFGDVGKEPDLPSDIDKLLASPCPFFEKKTIQETHLFVLIPKTVAGKDFTLKKLEELLKEKNITKYGYVGSLLTKLGDKTISQLSSTTNSLLKSEDKTKDINQSYWVLMLKECPKETKKKIYKEQIKILEDSRFKDYKVPSVLEAGAVIFSEYMQNKITLFPTHSKTYTRCKEVVENMQTIAGDFSSEKGLCLFNHKDYHENNNQMEGLGIAFLRRFY